ncbi:hypothetical protein C8J56DRAFT_1052470 [Mycena floridula]|nr:hypothetical protein C8J56DRAFT_1052470 [Mycena floridula]
MLPAIILIVWCIRSSLSLSLSIPSLIIIGNTADLDWTLDSTDPRGFELSLVSEDTSVSQGLSPVDSQGQNQGIHPILFNIGVFSEGIYHIEAFTADPLVRSLANTSSFRILSPSSNPRCVARTSIGATPIESTTPVVTPTTSLKIPGAIATNGIKLTLITAGSSPVSSSHISKHASAITPVTSSWSPLASSSAGPIETAVPGISKPTTPLPEPRRSHLPLILGLTLAGAVILFTILLILLRNHKRKIERLTAAPYIFNSVISARSRFKLVETAHTAGKDHGTQKQVV